MKKKENRGGARRVIDPAKGPAKRYAVWLYDAERAHLIDKYASLSKALKSLVKVVGRTKAK